MDSTPINLRSCIWLECNRERICNQVEPTSVDGERNIIFTCDSTRHGHARRGISLRQIPCRPAGLQPFGVFCAIIKVVNTCEIIPSIPFMRTISVIIVDGISSGCSIPNLKLITLVRSLAAEPATAHRSFESGVPAIDRREREGDQIVLALDERIGIIADSV